LPASTGLTRPPAIFLMGPTASGKTGLALELVRRLPCEIINVDSAQVFRHMDIGTSKPSREVLAAVPHRLIDIRDPAESYSAGQFRLDAAREMELTTARGRIPLLVGGTVLYFRALQNGLAALPQANRAVRAMIEQEARTYGWPRLHERLARIDPQAAARIRPNDSQRIQRALEVYELTGRTVTELWSQPRYEPFPYAPIKIVIVPAVRSAHGESVARRFEGMLGQGLIAEVEALYRRGDLDLQKPSMRAVGYRQVWEYLDGGVTYSEMTERAIIATRQLAKRQLTWLRAEENATWFDGLDSHLLQLVLNHLTYHGVCSRLLYCADHTVIAG
jgi:tRNA dimethylallyltransferase